VLAGWRDDNDRAAASVGRFPHSPISTSVIYPPREEIAPATAGVSIFPSPGRMLRCLPRVGEGGRGGRNREVRCSGNPRRCRRAA